jgi:hypothetical protein
MRRTTLQPCREPLNGYLQISSEKSSRDAPSGQAGANFAKMNTPHGAARSSESPFVWLKPSRWAASSYDHETHAYGTD